MMENSGLESADWSNPEFVPDDAGDTEPAELSTVDPSHIIHLIRQLLPDATNGKKIDAEQFSEKQMAVKSTREDLLINENCIPRAESDSVKDGSAKEIGSVRLAQEVGKLQSRKEVSDTVNATSPCGFATAELPASIATSKEGSQGVSRIHDNGSSTQKYGDNDQESGTPLEENSKFRLGRVKEGGNGDRDEAEQDTVLPDCTYKGRILQPVAFQVPPCPNWSSKSEEILNGKSINAGETDCGRKQADDEMNHKIDLDEDAREEAGCVLWDLAATESHAEFLVKHHILDVLQAYLVSHSDRMTEICLGILGNLACHSGPAKAMVAVDSLVEYVVHQLSVESIPCLTETCRLLSAGLHSEEAARWLEAIKPDFVLERIMWMAGNTLDSQLLEKCTELILVMVESRRDGAFVLLPSLLRLGLPGVLTDLIEYELGAISEGNSSRGDVILDIVLQIAEAMSISDESASQLAANEELFTLICEVIRLSASDEIGPSGITATVLIANLLTEESELIEKVLHDKIFLGRLLALVPCAGQDPGARNALWSILGRICGFLVSTSLGDPQYANSGVLAVLAEGCSVLLDDLEIHAQEDVQEEKEAVSEHDVAASTSRGLRAKYSTVINIMRIMDLWSNAHGGSSARDTPLFRSVRNAKLLLSKHVKTIETTSAALGKDMSTIVPASSRASSAPPSTS